MAIINFNKYKALPMRRGIYLCHKPAQGASKNILKTLYCSIIIMALLSIDCSNESNLVSSLPTPSLKAMYDAAIQDAVFADSNEICKTLVSITPVNTRLTWRGSGDTARVLVDTWTKYISSYPVGGTVKLVWGETWVTVPHEFTQWCNLYKPNPDSSLRIEQLLGLPPNKGYTYFVELWVRPTDLFRPAPDCEITDTIAGITIPSNADSTYVAWYDGNIIYSYFPPRFPWTRLGYTYDWGNPQSEIGLSEFVIRKNAPVIVNAVYTTSDYIMRQ